MTRRGYFKIREIAPDPKYNDSMVAKFVNQLMHDGKKTVAYKVFYKTLDKLSQNGEKGVEVFKKAIDNVSPTIGTKMKRIGGAVIQIPSEIRKEKQISLAMKWIIEIARKRSEKTMVEKLYKEITDASNNEGGAIKKKTDKQKMASSNKVFATLNF